MITSGTHSSPHMLADNSVSALMLKVIYALLPGIVVCFLVFGWGIIINLVIACLTAIAAEALVLKLRGRQILLQLTDGSAIVTAMLLALALPPLVPWWLTVVATGFAIIVAKHLYGGLGYNPFNPAMVGYVVAIISFPKEMTQWLIPFLDNSLTLAQHLSIQLGGTIPEGLQMDAITSATPMDSIKERLGRSQTIQEISNLPLFGRIAGIGWEWISVAFLAGGLWLLLNRTIRWHIPVAMLASMTAMALLFQWIDADRYNSALFHLFSGGTMLAAFFIATDPVTACTTEKGRLVYGAGIGILVYIIRTWGGYPDGIAFAILLMNMAAPTIDYYTQPHVFGGGRNRP